MDNFYEDHPLSSNSVDLALSTQKIPDEKEKNVVQQDDVIVASMEFCDDFEEPKPFTVTSPLQQNKIKHHIQSSVLANYVPKKQPQITPSTPSKPSQPKQKILLATPQIEQKIPTRQTVAQDDFVQEFMNNHKQELIDLTKTKDIELVFNSTQMNGLESVLQYPGIIVVLFSGDYIFGFQVTSSNNLIGFTIKNPFDIIPITFSLKNKADFTVDINTKHRILEVWHFIRLTGDEGFISDDFTDYYDDSTEVGPDLFIGEHQPELFSLDRFLAFRPY
ncbi:TLDc domain-containing protein [Entamoeba marina]